MAFRAKTIAWLSHKHRTRKDSARIDWKPLVATLLAECHEKQRGFVEDPSIRVCALVARGGGKTTGARARLVIKMLKIRRARCCFIATSRQQAEEFMWAPLKELCSALAIPASFNETKLKCTFLHNGSTLRLVGADDKKSVDKLRGQPFHEVCVDECASYRDALFTTMLDRVIIPRLGDFNGSLVCFGTPGHVLAGEFYDMTRTNGEFSRPYEDRDLAEFADWERWSRHHWTMEDGAKEKQVMENLWQAALRNKRAKDWTDDNPIWRREYLGFWAADDTENMYKYRIHDESGALWNQWDPVKTTDQWAVLPDTFTDWHYSYGQDMGHTDPYSLEVFAWSPSDPSHMLYHVYEFESPKMYARRIAELLIGDDPEDGTKWPDFDNLKGCIGRSGWPDANVADTAGAGGGILEELNKVYGITVKPAQKKEKHDNIELLNGDLIDGRMKIMKGSTLEAQFLSLQWQISEYNRLEENKSVRNDCADAAIYARREAAHLMSTTPDAKSPHIPEREDMMAVDSSEDSEDSDQDSASYLNDTSYSSDQW